MNFAIVKFIEEEDSPGIISTNWLNKKKNCCFFPNVRSEEKKNRLLVNRETPGSNWLECPVKVLKEFVSYQTARTRLSEAEETSNLDSCNESGNKSLKRKRRVMSLEQVESSSEEEDVIARTSKQHFVYSYPAPPIVESFVVDGQPSQGFKTFCQVPQHDSLPPTPELPLPETSERSTGIISNEGSYPSRKSAAAGSKTFRQVPPQYSGLSPNSELSLPETPERLTGMISNEGVYSSRKCSAAGCSHDIEQLIISQKNMWTMLTEFTSVAQQIQIKLDSLLASVQDLQAKILPQGQIQDEDISLLSFLPAGIDQFMELNNKIMEKPVFRQRLTKILMTAGGRDCKALAANVLRKLISDDVGEQFSLTGKRSKTATEKQPFEKTELYKLVLEICFRMFSATKENVVREAVSDWLMQAKFRKSRREKRMTSAQQVVPDETE